MARTDGLVVRKTGAQIRASYYALANRLEARARMLRARPNQEEGCNDHSRPTNEYSNPSNREKSLDLDRMAVRRRAFGRMFSPKTVYWLTFEDCQHAGFLTKCGTAIWED